LYLGIIYVLFFDHYEVGMDKSCDWWRNLKESTGGKRSPIKRSWLAREVLENEFVGLTLVSTKEDGLIPFLISFKK